MLTEREVLALEGLRLKLRNLRDKVSEAESALQAIATDSADLGNYDFDCDEFAEGLHQAKAEISDAILLIETDIEEYDSDDE